MKKIGTLFCLVVFLVSCSEDDGPMTENGNVIIEEMEEDSLNTATSSFEGDFVSLAHPTSGKAFVSDDGKTLTFANFKTDSGPKLLVYLSTDNDATAYVNLGDLKGIEGDFTYSIPENTDFERFKVVNIWCVDFSVSFGVAELKK